MTARVAVFGLTTLLCLAALAFIGSAAAQLSDAQKNALKSNCRSDYMSNCMSVTPGGKEALMCLDSHMATLSPGCQAAVKSALPPPPAAAAPPPPAPPPATAATPPPPAAAAAPPPPVVPKPAASTPPAQPDKKAKAAAPKALPKPTPPPQQVTAPPPPEAAPPTVPVAKIQALGLPQLLRIVRFCKSDREAVCPGVRQGNGRVVACLAAHQQALSPGCHQILAKALH